MNDASSHCPACGTGTVPGAAYCHRCGAPVSSVPSAAGTVDAVGASETVRSEAPVEGTAGVPAEAPEGGTVPPDSGTAEPVGAPGSGWQEPGPAGVSSAAAPAAADDRMARARRGEYAVRVGDWMSRGWGVFTQAGGFFLAFAAIGWALFALTWTTGIFFPFLVVLSPMVTAGCFVGALIVRRGGKLHFSEFWLPFHDFLPILLACLVSWALLLAGLCTCGIVTVYLWVGYQFAYLLILDRRLDFWDALETSRAVVTTKWIEIFAFALLLLLMNFVGLLTFTVGLIVTVPLSCCALVEAYADIFGIRGGMPGPATLPNVAAGAAGASTTQGAPLV